MHMENSKIDIKLNNNKNFRILKKSWTIEKKELKIVQNLVNIKDQFI